MNRVCGRDHDQGCLSNLTGAIVKNSGILQRGRNQIQKQHFRVLRVPFNCLAHSLSKQFYPNQWYRWKAETLTVCLLLIWRVCDQAFGRYRSLKDVEKWSRDHHKNWKYRHVEKFTDSKNAIILDLWRKITKVSRKNRFRAVASPGAYERLAVLNRRSSSIHSSSSYLKLIFYMPISVHAIITLYPAVQEK